MKVSVSNSLLDLYKKSKKNYNYALSFFLNSLDLEVCSKAMLLVENFKISGDKQIIEIDASNVSIITSIFGDIDDDVVERLMWMAIMLPEI